MSTTKRHMAIVGFLLLATVFFFVKGWFVAVPTLYAALIAATASRSRFVDAMALAAVTLCYLGLVLSHIASQAEFVAVAIYGLIIYIMGATAIFQQRRFYAWYVVAAMLFILSDSLIVCGKYLTTVPHGNTWVMLTYYAAQGLFMTLHATRRAPEE